MSSQKLCRGSIKIDKGLHDICLGPSSGLVKETKGNEVVTFYDYCDEIFSGMTCCKKKHYTPSPLTPLPRGRGGPAKESLAERCHCYPFDFNFPDSCFYAPCGTIEESLFASSFAASKAHSFSESFALARDFLFCSL